jgi:hypothetical protein
VPITAAKKRYGSVRMRRSGDYLLEKKLYERRCHET